MESGDIWESMRLWVRLDVQILSPSHTEWANDTVKTQQYMGGLSVCHQMNLSSDDPGTHSREAMHAIE